MVFPLRTPIRHLKEGDLRYEGKAITPDFFSQFMYKWLYTGWLTHTFGDLFDLMDFLVPGEDEEPYLHTGRLDAMIDRWIERHVDNNAAVEARHQQWQNAYSKMMGNNLLLSDTSSSVMLLLPAHLKLAIAALGEGVKVRMQVGLKRVHNEGLVPSQIIAWAHMMMVTFIEHFFLERNWCSSTIDRLSSRQERGIIYAWFCLNLPTPQADFDHSECSIALCKASVIDPATYAPKHTAEECECPLIGMPMEAIAGILQRGNLPLLVVDGEGLPGAKAMCIIGHEVPFVAFSHVCADGLGNV